MSRRDRWKIGDTNGARPHGTGGRTRAKAPRRAHAGWAPSKRTRETAAHQGDNTANKPRRSGPTSAPSPRRELVNRHNKASPHRRQARWASFLATLLYARPRADAFIRAIGA